MKTAFLSALAVAGAIGVAFSATTCDLAEIKTTLMANATIAAELTPAAAKCETDTGVDIFAITAFPTKETALKFQLSDKGCSPAINLVTRTVNINTRCTIEVNGTVVIYGDLISDFLAGKTGNESDSGSGSVEAPSESASGSESESESGSSSTASTNSTTTSDAATTALSFVTFGAIAAIAVALR
ncbi:hypothetical protein PR003_g18159 [Phytophthora rubi]|uniref:Elicitin n=1 Tax=Phytophthora rubi TaxID=129364 RepID=A0A6A4EA48_9STRA|nr:hypothetical protein PR001_g12588 [Phytophthora rubi]KAE9318766.1 hypothetical protein PR003_g18159 [Phytophthora rubi]